MKKYQKNLLLIFITLISLVNFAWSVDLKDLDSDRFFQVWEEVPSHFEGVWDTVDVTTQGILPDVLTGNGAKFQSLIDNHTGNVVYYFPAGTFYFDKNIEILVNRIDNDNLVIKGAGPDLTKLLFDCNVDYFGGLIHVEDKPSFGDRNNSESLALAPQMGDMTIELSTENNKIIPGRIICIKQDNDPALVYPDGDIGSAWYVKWQNGEADWGDESMGQFAKVKSVSGTTVTIEKTIGFDFSMAQNPRVSVYDSFGSKVGIEDLYIEHIIEDREYVAGGVNDIFNIALRFVSDSYVRNVHSVNATRGHVMAEYTYNIAIVNNTFEKARAYGVGGAGYGVAVQNRSSNTYIANNMLDHLRHSIMIKEGVNFSVIAYNVSQNWALLDPDVVDEDGNRIEAEADISIHGFYSHNNLFEGNICHNIFMADYWGPTGPGTVAFRNHTNGLDTLSGIWVDDFSHHESVIANELPAKANVFVLGGSEDVMVEGNLIGGSIVWNEMSSISKLPSSLYLNSKPSFWKDQLPWPAFGPDVSQKIGQRLPAEDMDNDNVTPILDPSKRSISINPLKSIKNFNLLGQRVW